MNPFTDIFQELCVHFQEKVFKEQDWMNASNLNPTLHKKFLMDQIEKLNEIYLLNNKCSWCVFLFLQFLEDNLQCQFS